MKIHLGKKYDFEQLTTPEQMDKEHFPSFHIEESDHKGLAKIPDSGKATIKFKVKDRHVHESNEDGKKSKGISLMIEVISFDVEPKRDKPKGNSDAREAFQKWEEDEGDQHNSIL